MRFGGAPVVAVALAALGGATIGPAAETVPVGISRAQSAALARAPGGLVNTTLALDRGRLVYGVAIDTAPGVLTRVEVDAASGKVLRVTAGRARSPFPAAVQAP